MPRFLFVLLLGAPFLGACAGKPYAQDPAGTLSGTLRVVWVGQGSAEKGDGKFLYVPDKAAPLTFVRKEATGPSKVIVPGVMFTDGGSIPKFAQVFGPLSPWGYGPAYVVHDWLFEAHHCIAAGKGDASMAAVEGMRFPQSVDILGEVIRTLQDSHYAAKDEGAAATVVAGVATPVSAGLWDGTGCTDRPTAAEVAAAEAAVAAPAPPKRMMRSLALRPGVPVPVPAPVKPAAKVVATFSF